jgi:hypothetical protein
VSRSLLVRRSLKRPFDAGIDLLVLEQVLNELPRRLV